MTAKGEISGNVTRASAGADEADRVAARMRPASDLIGRVALDGVDRAARIHALDDADVLMEDDEVPRLGRVARGGGLSAAGLLRPGVDRVDRTGAGAVRHDRDARLLARPGGEVGTPRADARISCGRGAVHGDARRVVRAGRLLGLPDLARRRGDDGG